MGGKEGEKGGWRQLGWAQLRWLNVFHMFVKKSEAFPASGQMNGWKEGQRKRSSPTQSTPSLPAISLSLSLSPAPLPPLLLRCCPFHLRGSIHTHTHTPRAPVTPAGLHRQPLCFREDFQPGYDYKSQWRHGRKTVFLALVWGQDPFVQSPGFI